MLHKTLPHRDCDPVLTLYAHYFLAADLMRTNFEKSEAKWKQRGRLSRNDAVNQSIYFCTWLGFLGVTCESFRKLGLRLLLQENRPKEFCELTPKVDEIGKAMKQNFDSLRKFRNSVFHLRYDTGEMERFLSKKVERLIWAEELHTAFKEFFSNYRILCQVHYVIHERTSEIDM